MANESEGADSILAPGERPRQVSHRIGWTVSAHVDRVVTGLMDGTIELWQLDQSLASMYYLGFEDGRASRDVDIRQLEHDRDRYYAVAYNDSSAVKNITVEMEKTYLATIYGNVTDEEVTRALDFGDRLGISREVVA